MRASPPSGAVSANTARAGPRIVCAGTTSGDVGPVEVDT